MDLTGPFLAGTREKQIRLLEDGGRSVIVIPVLPTICLDCETLGSWDEHLDP